MRIEEFKVSIIMEPHPWDNEEAPYFWSILGFAKSTWSLCDSGWAISPEKAWEEASKQCKILKENNETEIDEFLHSFAPIQEKETDNSLELKCEKENQETGSECVPKKKEKGFATHALERASVEFEVLKKKYAKYL